MVWSLTYVVLLKVDGMEVEADIFAWSSNGYTIELSAIGM